MHSELWCLDETRLDPNLIFESGSALNEFILKWKMLMKDRVLKFQIVQKWVSRRAAIWKIKIAIIFSTYIIYQTTILNFNFQNSFVK